MNFKSMLNRIEVAALLLALILAILAPATSIAQAQQSQRPTASMLPTPGAYKIDSDHSFAYFGARHHIFGLVRGRFDKVTGTVTSANDPAACALDVVIDVASLSTQIAERDEDLRSPVYFDVKNFPTMTYRGRGIRRVSANTWIMDGTLTMHGVAKTVPLTFNFNGAFTDIKPRNPARVAFHGTAGVKRAEFGMGARDNLEELGMLTSPDVAIEIDVEADAATAPK